MWYHGPSPKMVINLSKTYEKLSCKGEPYQFSDWRDPLVTADTHTHTQTSCYFIIRICDTLPEIVIILSRTYEIYTIKETHIGSAIIDILYLLTN